MASGRAKVVKWGELSLRRQNGINIASICIYQSLKLGKKVAGEYQILCNARLALAHNI